MKQPQVLDKIAHRLEGFQFKEEREERGSLRCSSWSRMLARVFKIDVMHCEKCGGLMKALYAVTKAGSVQRYLRHVGLDPLPPACAPPLKYVTSASDYGENLTRALLYMARNGKVGGQGTDVWVMDPVGLLQLVQNESILRRTVKAHGKQMTCAELQTYVGDAEPIKADESASYSPLLSVFVAQFPRSPAYYCPTVFGLALDGQGKENQITLANRLRSYREEIEASLAKLRKDPLFNRKSGEIRLHRIDDTGKISFTGDDVAQDCFHLSLTGQLKIARIVVEKIPQVKP